MPLGPDNRYGVGWFGVETELETEQGAIREVDPRASRFWKVKNTHSRLPTTGARLRPRCVGVLALRLPAAALPVSASRLYAPFLGSEGHRVFFRVCCIGAHGRKLRCACRKRLD
jgi:hypothetical protein